MLVPEIKVIIIGQLISSVPIKFDTAQQMKFSIKNFFSKHNQML